VQEEEEIGLNRDDKKMRVQGWELIKVAIDMSRLF
jgi:hypothetical protein